MPATQAIRPLASWYTADINDPSLDPARDAFAEAVKVFGSKLTNDLRKRDTASQSADMEAVFRAVSDAQQRYNASQKSSKAWKWLSRFSSRVQYYGNIMDVLVQHHPEYVSLAWGAMKFLFGAVVNHETMISSLAKGLSQIGDCLPRLQLASVLYPTKMMKSAVAELYAHIIRFCIRAQDWYQEGKVLHMLHAITRPVELRYADLIEDIERCSRNVDGLAVAGSQAEQRDMHVELQDLIKRQQRSDETLLEMKQLIISYQAINSSAHLDTNMRLSDLQLSQILNFTSNMSLIDPIKSFQYGLFMRNRRHLTAASSTKRFWLDSKFDKWKTSPESSLIIVQGQAQLRADLRDFCVNVVEALRDANVPVLWALKTVDRDATHEPSVVDLIKDLVSQALRVNTSLQTDQSLAINCARFQRASTESDWFGLLGAVLAGIPETYIIIDTDIVSSIYANTTKDFSLPPAFLDLFQGLSSRGVKTVLRVILVSYRPNMSLQSHQQGIRDRIVHAGKAQQKRGPESHVQRFPGRSRGRGRGSALRTWIGSSASA